MQFILKLFLLFFFLFSFVFAKDIKNSNPKKEEIVLVYPKEIYLKIPKPKYEGEPSKEYTTIMLQSILADLLSIQTKVWLFNVSPTAIQYKESAEQDYSFQNFLKDDWFPLKVRRDKDVSIQDFLVTMKIIYKETGDLHVTVDFSRSEKIIYKKKIKMREEKINQEMQKLANEIRSFLSGKESGNLTITSTPSSASVYLDNNYFGQTPLHLKHIGFGSYQLSLKKENFQDLNQVIKITKEQNLFPFDLSLKTGPGSVKVTSNPSGAEVYVDNTLLGITPIILKDLSIGFYRITLYLEKHKKYQTDIQISSKNFNQQLNIALVPHKKISYEKWMKRNLDAAKAMGYISAGLAITGVAMLISKDTYLEKDSRGIYSNNSPAWKKNQKQIELFDNLAIGFFIGAATTLISGVAIYINYLNLISKSQRKRTTLKLNTAIHKNKPYFSFAISTKY